jgi:pyruvate formate lyase activating enzyme
VIRLPLITGINDSRENLEATAEFALSLSGVKRIDILSYHRLGEPKYRRLERDYPLAGQPSLPAERIAWARQILEQQGLEVRIGG